MESAVNLPVNLMTGDLTHNISNCYPCSPSYPGYYHTYHSPIYYYSLWLLSQEQQIRLELTKECIKSPNRKYTLEEIEKLTHFVLKGNETT
jgi:hypothetical protein